MRMQELAWGTPLDIFQSFYTGNEEQPQSPEKSDKQK